ncbi:MAG: hypothetical protein RL318_2545 [Fibrobacterota bacterium]|jgi:hypothetical protein
MRRALLSLSILLCLGACKTPWEKEPQLTPEEARFARLFAQSRIASQTFAGDPEKAKAARQALLAKEGMTLAQVRSCVASLQKSPDHWLPFWKTVREYAQTNGEKNVSKRLGTDGRKL